MNRNDYFPVVLIFVAAVAVTSPAFADNDVFEPVIVTATRMQLPADESLASIIVIDREEIERSLAADVAELLRFHAGLELGRNGGPGQTTSLFIRGTESNHALVMLDGVEINPGTIGGAALQNISPRLIQRIEVVKGPRSSLYGSEAIGGVVNIITRKTDGLEVRAGAGRYTTREASLSAGMMGTIGDLSASLSRLRSDGFPTRTADGAPDRGYDNQSLGLNASTTLGRSEVSLRHWESSGNTEYLDFFLDPVDQDYQNRATALAIAGQPAGNWSTTVTFSRITDDITQQQGPDFARTDRNSMDWQNDVQLAERHRVVAGIYVSREKTQASSFGTGFDERTGVDAYYVEDYIDFEPGQLLLAARFTDHDTFADNTTWNVEYGRRLANGWRLTAAAGTAFRAPDATDRFGFGGNPELLSEESQNIEFGIDRRFGSYHWLRFSLFRNEIEDLIEYFDGGNLNVAEARVTGLDAGYRWHNTAWRINVNAIFQDPEDRQAHMQLARRAKRSLTVNATRQFADYSVGLDVLATSARRDSPFSETINAGYVLANLSAQWQLSAQWALQG
ncbi:MAG: TonB-dependent receptor plug domain-containing protein, partial [Gammaproteobacteria bacterium]|nr:TonB-dependent receptor plug domain-containing protein [Gammaproteobacteria bacterium]